MATTSTLHPGEPRKLTKLWSIFRKHLIKIVLLVAISAAAMTTYVEMRTKIYTAYAEILIEQNDTDYRDLSEGNTNHAAPVKPEELEIEQKRVASALTLQEVVEELGLTFEKRGVPGFRAWVQAMIPLKMQKPESDNERRAMARQLDAFRDNLVIKRAPLASVISIGYSSPDPEEAADVANALARTYLRNRAAGRRQGVEKAVHDLERVADQISASVLKAEQETEQYRAKENLYAIDGILPVERHFNRLSRELTEATLDLAQARARLLQAAGDFSTVASSDLEKEQQNASLIDKLRAETERGISERDKGTEGYPAKTGGTDTRSQGFSKAFGAHENPSIEQRRLEVNVAFARHRELEKQTDKARAALSNSWDSRLHLRELERKVADLRQSYPAMQQRLQRAREQKQLLSEGVRIIGPATIPSQPSNVSGLLLIGMTLAGSCLASLGWAWLSEARRSGFNDAFEVETELGQPVLGILPRVNGIATIDSDLENAPRERQWSLEAYGFLEGVRGVLNTILPNSRGDGPKAGKVVLLTSSFPDEGKTTLALSLARQAAFAGTKTVLIEGDMRKTGLMAKLSTVVPEKGLVDLLRETVDEIDSALVKEPESGADLLLAAGPHEDAFALSRSPRMKVVIDDLKQRYDLIVIDCPPVLGVSDTRAMCDMADEVLFVVRWQSTHKAAAQSALRELERETIQIAGVVLTQVNLTQHLKYSTADKFRYQDAYEAYAHVTPESAKKPSA